MPTSEQVLAANHEALMGQAERIAELEREIDRLQATLRAIRAVTHSAPDDAIIRSIQRYVYNVLEPSK